MANKQDSNLTGLRFAEETALKTLPGTPIWYPLEPNSYSDFGGQLKTVARNPINPSRQRKKGVISDLDAAGGFNQDLTFNNTTRLLQGFFFADIREKMSTAKMNGITVLLTSVTSSTKTIAAASGLLGFKAGDLLYLEGFTNSGNNGVKTAASNSTATAIVTTEALVDEASPPTAAKVTVVGKQLGLATSAITMNGSLARLTDTATDFTTLGLVAGEWVYLGGAAASTKFVNNTGWARVDTITAGYLEFGKTSWTPVAEAGTGLSIQLFLGSVLKNESDPTLIKRRTYQVERALGNDGAGTMSEYLVGAVPNELTVNIPQAEKVNVDMSFVAVDNEQRNGTLGLKAGTRPTLTAQAALNTSSDFARIKLASVAADSAPAPLFAYATEMTLTLNNNVTPNKAVGVLGAFDTSAGTFEVGGKMTAYFATVDAVQAVRNNSDITLDLVMTKTNKAIVIDVPLLSLGDGRLNVEMDQPITLPLENNAAESSFGHTLLITQFPYVPV